jgi:hypothetical protein
MELGEKVPSYPEGSHKRKRKKKWGGSGKDIRDLLSRI